MHTTTDTQEGSEAQLSIHTRDSLSKLTRSRYASVHSASSKDLCAPTKLGMTDLGLKKMKRRSVFPGHFEEVLSVSTVSERLLASASTDRTVRLWDLETGECVRVLEGHYGAVESVCMVTERLLVSGSTDTTVKVWDVCTGECVHTLTEHFGFVTSVCMVPVGLFASGSDDKTVKLWDVRTGECLQSFVGHSKSVRCLCMVSASLLASGSCDKTVRLWDVRTGECVRVFTGHLLAVLSVCAVSATVFASGSQDDKIRLWDVHTGTCVHTLHGHDDIHSLCMVSAYQLASSSSHNTVAVWDLSTGAVTQIIGRHTRSARALCLVAEGQIVSGSLDGKVIRSGVTRLPAESRRKFPRGSALRTPLGEPFTSYMLLPWVKRTTYDRAALTCVQVNLHRNTNRDGALNGTLDLPARAMRIVEHCVG